MLRCSRVIGSLASCGKRPTCGTQLPLHKQLPPALANRRVPLAPPAPTAVLPSPGTPFTAARAALGAEPRASVGALRWLGDATPDLVQAHVMAGSTVSDALAATPPNADLPSDDVSDASDASVATVNSSNCDPPDEVPVISAPDLAAVLAAQDVTDVLLADLTAPLVTISLEEKALAPAAPLLRVPYLERLLEAVRDGTPLDRLPDALRPAVIQTHDDLATYITELVLALFDGDQLRGLQGQLQPFRGLADPLTVRRAVLSQMRYVADVASSLPSNAYSTSGGLFRLQRVAAPSLPVSSSRSSRPAHAVTLQPNGSLMWPTRPLRPSQGGT